MLAMDWCRPYLWRWRNPQKHRDHRHRRNAESAFRGRGEDAAAKPSSDLGSLLQELLLLLLLHRFFSLLLHRLRRPSPPSLLQPPAQLLLPGPPLEAPLLLLLLQARPRQGRRRPRRGPSGRQGAPASSPSPVRRRRRRRRRLRGSGGRSPRGRHPIREAEPRLPFEEMGVRCESSFFFFFLLLEIARLFCWVPLLGWVLESLISRALFVWGRFVSDGSGCLLVGMSWLCLCSLQLVGSVMGSRFSTSRLCEPPTLLLPVCLNILHSVASSGFLQQCLR